MRHGLISPSSSFYFSQPSPRQLRTCPVRADTNEEAPMTEPALDTLTRRHARLRWWIRPQ